MKIDIVTTIDATDMTLLELAPIVDRIKAAVDPTGPRRYIKMRLGGSQGIGGIKQAAYGAIINGTPAVDEKEVEDALYEQRIARAEILRHFDEIEQSTAKFLSETLGGKASFDDATRLLEVHRQFFSAVGDYMKGEEKAEAKLSIAESVAFR